MGRELLIGTNYMQSIQHRVRDDVWGGGVKVKEMSVSVRRLLLLVLGRNM